MNKQQYLNLDQVIENFSYIGEPKNPEAVVTRLAEIADYWQTIPANTNGDTQPVMVECNTLGELVLLAARLLKEKQDAKQR